jgi:aspartate racemase
MGPESTSDLFLKIIKNTPARKDQEHLRIIIDNNPKIPDRTKAIVYGEDDPLPYLIQSAERLQKARADFIIIPCNAAHHWLEQLRVKMNIPIMNMIEEGVRAIKEELSIKKAGLLATLGTLRAGLYQKEFKQSGLELIEPIRKERELLMKAIYGIKGIKAGYKREGRKALLTVGRRLIDRGAEAIVEGCTEIPLVLSKGDFSAPLIDPTEILARASINKAKGLKLKRILK